MKILLVTPEQFPVPAVLGGAVETLVTTLIKEHEKHDNDEHNIYVASVYDKNALEQSLNYKKTNMIYISMRNNSVFKFINKVISKILRRNISSYIYQYKIYKKVKNENIDIVVIEGGNIFLYKYLKRKMKRSKFIAHLHGNVEGDERLHKIFCKYITISNYVNNVFIQNKIINKNKSTILNNCIDIEKFNDNLHNEEEKLLLRKDLNINKDDIVITFCGRTIAEKGIKELICAFKKMKNIDKCKLLIIGNSQFGQNLQTSYDRELLKISQDIKDKIIFTGFIHNNELPKYLSITDIDAVPSIWEEPSGLVVLEAMASGLPIVTTDAGGIPELVNDKCAISIKRDENLIDNMARSLDYLVLNPELRKKMGQEGKKQVKKYNKDEYYKKFISIISKI